MNTLPKWAHAYLQRLELEQRPADSTITSEAGEEQKILLRSPGELEAAVAEEFGLPRLPVRQAAEILRGLGVDIFETQTDA